MEQINVERNVPLRNRLPVFFDMEQSANVLAMSSWYSAKVGADESEIIDLDSEENEIGHCAKNPIHILSIERIGSGVFDYNYEQYGSNPQLNEEDVIDNWLFDSWQYCQTDGSLLAPFYRFDCVDGEEPRQTVELMMFVVPAQQMKTDKHVSAQLMTKLKTGVIDLNKMVDFGEDKRNWWFGHPMRVCRNTNLVFSTYEQNGLNKVKCAFLGQFANSFEDGQHGIYSTKRSSCDALTRYEYDSQAAKELSLTKGSHFKGRDEDWRGFTEDGQEVEFSQD